MRKTVAKVDTKWFQEQVKKTGYSQNGLASRIGMDPGSLSQSFYGRRHLLPNECTALAKEFGVPLEEVLTAAGVEGAEGMSRETMKLSGVVTVGQEVRGYFPAWVTQVVYEPPKGNFAIVPRPVGSPATLKALRYQTSGSDVSALQALDGMVIYYSGRKPVKGALDLAECFGKPCVFEFDLSLRGPEKPGSIIKASAEDLVAIVAVPKRGHSSRHTSLYGVNGQIVAENFENARIVNCWPITWMRMS